VLQVKKRLKTAVLLTLIMAIATSPVAAFDEADEWAMYVKCSDIWFELSDVHSKMTRVYLDHSGKPSVQMWMGVEPLFDRIQAALDELYVLKDTALAVLEKEGVMSEQWDTWNHLFLYAQRMSTAGYTISSTTLAIGYAGLAPSSEHQIWGILIEQGLHMAETQLQVAYDMKLWLIQALGL